MREGSSREHRPRRRLRVKSRPFPPWRKPCGLSSKRATSSKPTSLEFSSGPGASMQKAKTTPDETSRSTKSMESSQNTSLTSLTTTSDEGPSGEVPRGLLGPDSRSPLATFNGPALPLGGALPFHQREAASLGGFRASLTPSGIWRLLRSYQK